MGQEQFSEAALAGFDQGPAVQVVFEGPDLVIAALSAAGRSYLPQLRLVGRPAEALADLGGGQLVERVREVYATGQPFHAAELRLGETFVNLSMVPWREPDEGIRGVIVLGVDVTGLVRAPARLSGEPSGELPLLPGVRLAVGPGDGWFDALPLPDGRVALAVGAGSTELRTVLRERLGSGADLGAAVGAVDRYAAGLPGARPARVSVAVVDQGSGEVRYHTAGHPPPLVVSPGGARYLPEPATGAAGAVGAATLAAGEVLLLHGEGPVEWSDEDLAQVVAADQAGVPLAELLISGFGEDVTVLAAERVAPPPVLELEVPAEPSSVRKVRTELGEWLAAVGASTPSLVALQHAVGEVVTNAAVHAYPPDHPHRTVAVRVVLEESGAVCASVADRGRWDTSVDPAGGLTLARSLVDAIQVDRRDPGTTVVLRHRLTRFFGPPPAPPAGEFDVALSMTPAPRLSVHGPVDVETAEKLAVELDRAGRADPLTVDLTGVTHLASAGVRVLRGTGASVHAPPGSVAHQVLSLVPH
ncbi:ATP-binding protein [Actinophytocola sp.]|uniref:ATP-binding protein n=1 Tax=Actinophytocola sp. TaxID=1872138 RepID=UPI002ED908ED